MWYSPLLGISQLLLVLQSPLFSQLFVSAVVLSPKLRRFCRVHLRSYLRKEREEGSSLTWVTYLVIFRYNCALLMLCQQWMCFLYLFAPYPVGFRDALHPLARTLLIRVPCANNPCGIPSLRQHLELPICRQKCWVHLSLCCPSIPNGGMDPRRECCYSSAIWLRVRS